MKVATKLYRSNSRSSLVKLSRYLGLFMVLGFLSGCVGAEEEPRAEVANVKGKVTFQGKPVEDGQIVFTNTQIKTDVVGQLGPGGTYLATNLVVGDFVVTVRPTPPPSTLTPVPNPPKISEGKDIPPKYRSATTSGLTTTIDLGENTFDVDMK